MNETDLTVQRFREYARQGGLEFIALDDSGYLHLCSTPPTGPAMLGYAPAESAEAADLVRRAIDEFGLRYLTPAELAGYEAELRQQMDQIRAASVSRSLSSEAVRRLAERHLRRRHALLHCTFPTSEGGLFEVWLCEDGIWETDHPGVSSGVLTQAVHAFLATLKQD